MLRAIVTIIGNLQGGDMIYLRETIDGYPLISYDKELVRQMEMAEQIMQEEKEVLKVLADS